MQADLYFHVEKNMSDRQPCRQSGKTICYKDIKILVHASLILFFSGKMPNFMN